MDLIDEPALVLDHGKVFQNVGSAGFLGSGCSVDSITNEVSAIGIATILVMLFQDHLYSVRNSAEVISCYEGVLPHQAIIRSKNVSSPKFLIWDHA